MPRLLIPLAALALAAAPAIAQPARTFVYIFDFDFSINQPGEPIADAVINPGDIITWVPLNEFHNTIAAAGQAEFWASEILSLDDTFDWVFTTPGVYHYYCSPHGSDNGDGTASGMAGTITVLPTPATAILPLTAATLATRRRRHCHTR